MVIVNILTLFLYSGECHQMELLTVTYSLPKGKLLVVPIDTEGYS